MPTNDENYRKHLEFVQLNIARMAAASFLYKSWMVASVSALFAAYAASSTKSLVLVALIPVIAFWILDAFHLATEKRFRELYERIRNGTATNFEMRPPATTLADWLSAVFTKTLVPLYVPLLIVVCASYVLISGDSNGP